jgi:hypothetical protein
MSTTRHIRRAVEGKVGSPLVGAAALGDGTNGASLRNAVLRFVDDLHAWRCGVVTTNHKCVGHHQKYASHPRYCCIERTAGTKDALRLFPWDQLIEIAKALAPVARRDVVCTTLRFDLESFDSMRDVQNAIGCVPSIR